MPEGGLFRVSALPLLWKIPLSLPSFVGDWPFWILPSWFKISPLWFSSLSLSILIYATLAARSWAHCCSYSRSFYLAMGFEGIEDESFICLYFFKLFSLVMRSFSIRLISSIKDYSYTWTPYLYLANCVSSCCRLFCKAPKLFLSAVLMVLWISSCSIWALRSRSFLSPRYLSMLMTSCSSFWACCLYPALLALNYSAYCSRDDGSPKFTPVPFVCAL